MTHIGRKINALADADERTITEIAAEMKKTVAAVYNDFKMADLNTKALRKYSEVLGVPVIYWFQDEVDIVNDKGKKKKEDVGPNESKAIIRIMEKELEIKNEQIKKLSEQVEFLQDQIKKMQEES